MTTFFPKYIFLLAELWMSFSNGLVLQDFFPDVNQNLTKITWAHAVNNQSYLNNTLSDGGINMIEADIVLGKLNGIGNDIPIMGHPPANISDLSLDSFLQQVTAFNVNATNTTRKGVKLDFKTIEVFEKSVQIVAQFDKGAFPIWINADILRGPINATNTPVNATRFFKGAETFSNSILSVGWTTLYGNTTTGSYDQTQINAMIDTIKANNVMQDITFPVRAGLAAESIDLLVNLTQEIENSTLTIWSSEGDNVNVEHLRELIKTIGINKTYVDVPSDLLSKLHLDSLSHSSPVAKLASGVLLVCLIIFRHGNRTADKQHELYPKDPYLHEPYHPYGNGQLTKYGKHKEFSVGKSLRQRYHNLLGDYYYPDVIDAYSTDYDRTKASLQLVLAGLFPPRKEDMFEDDILWQPVPFKYLPKNKDKVLLGVLCPTYLEMYEQVSRSEEVLQKFSEHLEAFNYIAENTGLNVSRFYHLYNLYFGLSTEEEWGFKLPDWTKPVWPDTITRLATKDYFISMHTHPMRQMATGYFLEKIIEDTKSKILSSNMPGKKMYLYSAHENNLAELLMSLNLFDEPHVPNYGAWISLEVHFINGIYGIKVFYENHRDGDPRLLSIPECGTFCPLDTFIEITAHLIPDAELCGI